MNLKKILAGAVASVLAVSTMAVGSFAEADGTFEWELAGQFDADFNDAAEWPDGVKGTGKVGEEITAVWEFDDAVKLATNYFGFKTVGVAWSGDEGAVNPYIEVVSFKADDRTIAVDNEKMKLNAGDNDSATGNLKCVFYNAWDNNITGGYAIDVDEVNGEEGFEKLEVVFKVVVPADANADDNNGDNNIDDNTDDTTAPDNTPADGSNPSGGEKDPTNTGIEGVAVVAGLAVLATGAIVIAKKRK